MRTVRDTGEMGNLAEIALLDWLLLKRTESRRVAESTGSAKRSRGRGGVGGRYTVGCGEAVGGSIGRGLGGLVDGLGGGYLGRGCRS